MPVNSPVIAKTDQAFTSSTYRRRVGPALAVLLLSLFIFIMIWLILGFRPFEDVQSDLVTILLYLACYSPAWLTFLLAIWRFIQRRKYPEQAQTVNTTVTPLSPEQIAVFARTAGGRGHFAGMFSRFIALMIDLTIISLTSIGVQVFLQIAEPVLGIINLMNHFVQLTGIDEQAIAVLKFVANILFFFGYFVVQWSLFGKTIGKGIMGLKVVTRHGLPPAPWQSVMRMFGYFISSISLMIGFLWAGVDRYRRAWQDILAGTFVVYDWDAKQDGWFLMHAIHKQQTNLEQKLEKKKQPGSD